MGSRFRYHVCWINIRLVPISIYVRVFHYEDTCLFFINIHEYVQVRGYLQEKYLIFNNKF